MKKEEAIEICKRFMGCQKRIKNCFDSCEGCNWDYKESDVAKAVAVLVKELETEPDREESE